MPFCNVENAIFKNGFGCLESDTVNVGDGDAVNAVTGPYLLNDNI